jgi:hypothetical protein
MMIFRINGVERSYLLPLFVWVPSTIRKTFLGQNVSEGDRVFRGFSQVFHVVCS